jgi:hypothetical protein
LFLEEVRYSLNIRYTYTRLKQLDAELPKPPAFVKWTETEITAWKHPKH